MNTIKRFLAFLVMLGFTGLLSAMEAEVDPKYIKIQDIPKGQLIIADNGGKIENGVEYINLNAEDPITYETFNEKLLARARYKIPYILAVVSYKQQNPPGIRHTYYDAATINEYLFGDINKTKIRKDKRLFRYNFDKKNQTHPATRATIDSVTYIALDPENKIAKVIGTSENLKAGSPNEQALTRLFFGTKAFDAEKDPSTLKIIAKRIREHYSKMMSNL